MKQVSQAYKDSMASSVRNRSLVRVQLLNGDADASIDGVWSTGTSSVAPWSNAQTLSTNVGKLTPTMHTCEWNRCLFDDEWHFVTDTTQVREGAVAQMGQGMELTKTFDRLHTFPGITICFDPVCNEYVKSIFIVYFGENDTRLYTSPELSVTQATQYFPHEGVNVKKVVIKTGQIVEGRRARIFSVFFGLYALFENADIKSVRIMRDVDPISRRAPKTDVQFSILDYDKQYDFDNPTGKWLLLDEHAKVSIQFGYELTEDNIEWLTPDKFVLDGRPSFRDHIATFHATSTLESTYSLYTDSIGAIEFTDPEIKRISGFCYMPIKVLGHDVNLGNASYLKSARPIECLQLLAHASRRTLYVDNDDVVVIDDVLLPDWQNPVAMHTLTNKDIVYHTQKAYKNPRVKDIKIKYHRYRRDASSNENGVAVPAQQVLYDDVPVFPNGRNSITLHFDFKTTPLIDIFILYQGIYSKNLYSNYLDVTVVKNDANPNTRLLIIGTKVLDVPSEFFLPVYSEGESEIIDNPLVSNPYPAAWLLQNSLGYLAFRNVYEFEYRGDPAIEVRDLIEFQTPYTERVFGQIIKTELTFNGALHGKLIVKALDKQDLPQNGQSQASLMGVPSQKESDALNEQDFSPYVVPSLSLRPNSLQITSSTTSEGS